MSPPAIHHPASYTCCGAAAGRGSVPVTTDRANELRAGGPNSLVRGGPRILLVLTSPFRGGKRLIAVSPATRVHPLAATIGAMNKRCTQVAVRALRYLALSFFPTGHHVTSRLRVRPLRALVLRRPLVVRSLIESLEHPLAAAVSASFTVLLLNDRYNHRRLVARIRLAPLGTSPRWVSHYVRLRV